MIDWKPVLEANPDQGERLLVYNGISAWATRWRWVLTDKTLDIYPVTHVAELNLPYPMGRNQATYSELEDKIAALIKKCRS